MAARRIDPRAVKLNRSYDVGELAARFGVHKNTVRHWQRQGLSALDESRPSLFQGSTVRDFLTKRNAKGKSLCPPGTMYCFSCRAPRAPAGAMVDFVPINPTSGNIRALCSACETVMHRRAARSALATVMPDCEIQFMEGPSRLTGQSHPSLNCDFARKVTTR